MGRCFIAALMTAFLAIPAAAAPAAPEPPRAMDHSKFGPLQQDFKTGPEATKACLTCHPKAGEQILKTKHWTWEFANPKTGQALGKKNIINNFCVAVASNEARCTSCHIGYGWKDASFDFSAKENIDCLVCHDTTGSYKKFPTGAGHPNYQPAEWPMGSGTIRPAVDLKKVAQNVGPTSRATCGACHFFGGGGNAVKHGDIDSSLGRPDKALDVHMDANGLNFTCSTCHRGDEHMMQGSRYTTMASAEQATMMASEGGGPKATCESCHGIEPHETAKLNDHTDRVACVTCHVPAFARGGFATKMRWDWSTAGQEVEGKRVMKNAKGEVVHDFMKGDFVWAENVVPDYRWFNGDIRYTLLGDEVKPGEVVKINSFGGSADDPEARIWPFKVFTGVQPYDAGAKTLAVPHLFGKDENAFWKTYDWNKSLAAGMKAVGHEYSGTLGFIETEMAWPITHMVAPKEEAVACNDCHAADGRLFAQMKALVPGWEARRP